MKNYDLRETLMTEDSAVFKLEAKDTATISFGIGTWSDKEIDEVLKSINDIEIETSDLHITYKSKAAMKNLFKENTKGVWLKTDIIIELK